MAEAKIKEPRFDRIGLSSYLKHLGYNDETANDIWDHWSFLIVRELDGISSSMPFIKFAASRLGRSQDLDTSDEEDEAWYAHMNHCDINSETQASIMDPIFKKIRSDRVVSFWYHAITPGQ